MKMVLLIPLIWTLEVIRHVTFHKNRISVDSDKQWTNKIHGWDWQEYTTFLLHNFPLSNYENIWKTVIHDVNKFSLTN